MTGLRFVPEPGRSRPDQDFKLAARLNLFRSLVCRRSAAR
jgi:hypothetical protein